MTFRSLMTWPFLVAGLLALALPTRSLAIEVTGANLPGDTTLQILTGSVTYQAEVRGTDGELNTPYSYIVYVVGTDIYGNVVYLDTGDRGRFTVSGQQNVGGVVEAATTFTIGGDGARWTVPNDGTLHNIIDGYRLTVAIYRDPPGLPTILAGLDTGLAIILRSGQLNIDVLPDLAIRSPGVTYRAGNYRGGDVIPFTVNWRNNPVGEGDRQSRPLKFARDSVEDETDTYVSDLRLTTNPEFGGTNNDDFLLSRLLFRGDVPAIPDASTVLRSVTVTTTPPAVPPHGLNGVAGSQRVYTPQPDDGYLDIGESVSVELDTLIPRNYSNPNGYFVAVRVSMVDPDEDARANNTFVSNAANKIAILPTDDPTLDVVSAVSRQNGEFVKGGDAASDLSSVSEEGNVIAFASRATNLLDLPNGVPGRATFGQQIFAQYRQTREIFLVSANLAGAQANADCFNPFISADGNFVAYDSRATNLGVPGTGGRSMIYVYNVSDDSTTVVSKSSLGIPANGDSFNPRLSASGRFVTFQSVARNLDPARPLPSSNRNMQVYLHDRDVNGSGVFDQPGNIATYLVSINNAGQIANGWCNNAVVSLNDAVVDLDIQGGVFVAYSSYARNMEFGSGFSMIYRVRVVPSTGPVADSVVAVSLNDAAAPPAAFGVDPVGAFIRPDCDEASINGDGSQIAFTSYATNFVLNETDGTYTPTFANGQPNNPAAPVNPALLPGGDYNRVPDIFVRDMNRELTTRVSVSEPRVATGTITFGSALYRPSPPPGGPGIPAGNIPVNQPTPGNTITLDDGINPPLTLTFATAVGPTNVLIGATVFQTRDNLVNAINSAELLLKARPTTPPNAAVPGTAYEPAIYIYNLLPGNQGNKAMISSNPLVVRVDGMSGGGTQAEDDARAPGNTNVAPIQGVPFGSNQPSIDRSGRYVAFRTIATNLDVHTRTDQNNYPGSPDTGELIRPLVFPASNVYLHNRDADETGTFDQPGNFRTHRVSVNRFGYKTLIDGSEVSGVGASTSANSSRPSISANGRFVSFSSDSSGEGGLIFGPNNLSPLDNLNVRDVFVADQQVTGDNPVPPDTLPTVDITTPFNGFTVAPGTEVTVAATATPKGRKAIVSARCEVNGNPIGILTETPFAWSFVADPAGDYIIEVIAVDNRGAEGSSFVVIRAPQPVVPTNAAPGSNARFVVDYFQRIYFRRPSYPEYETYLNMLEGGATQAETIVAMMQSPQYAAAQNVLFGYYLRMGLAPASTNVVSNYLFNMTTGTNADLIPETFLPMSALAGTPPYGATIGQAKVAETLLNSVNQLGTNKAVRTMDKDEFRAWMLRSFNSPYLPQPFPSTNQVYIIGSQGTMDSNIQTVPSTTNSALTRYAYNYAYMSAFYANMPTNSLMPSWFTNFNNQVQGIALNFSLAPGNPWATNTAALSTNLAASLLPPVITNRGTNTVTVSNNFSTTVGGQNLLSNTVYSWVTTNFPPTVTITTNSGRMVISGQFTNTGTYPISLVASNGPGLVGTNRLVYEVLPQKPMVGSAVVTGSVGNLLSYSVPAENAPSSFHIEVLPVGISLNTSSGLLRGVPMESGVIQTTLTASNAGGATEVPLTFDIKPASPMMEWLVERGLVGADALPESDPDGDGHSNIVEFAFGMQPDVADDIPARYEFSSDRIVITWTRRQASTEVVYQILQSSSLTDEPAWAPVAGITPVVVQPEPGVVVPPGYERVRAVVIRPEDQPNIFYKVIATLTPQATKAP